MIDRLKFILDHYNLTSTNFAEKIDVPKSSISHLLSGRNKPSLDFIMKVDKAFDEVDLVWLLYGKGSFPKNNDDSISLFNQELNKKPKTEAISKNNFDNSEKSDNFSTLPPKILTKVILLYSDGTFDVFDK
ncbi:helix-turn-helix domain-containing protein [Tenacibaculum jejuense]|uniref:HTH_3 family transcriptional regulator protein n=1 Tax=Tenacibaculum jejuense TaxID=584609 RepID=A0A238U9Q1_9FLAO|nr:helix-turn-helix transcriptional regulator [Tenacibaculum jejuense]SNR15726.1 HTH_3 family transcriptional regulator protein [Tenacibaculum jejuense]